MPLCARSRGLLPLASVGHERRLNLQQQALPEIGPMIAVDTVFAVKSKMTGFGAGANGQRFGL
jgi:hypothetical protein